MLIEGPIVAAAPVESNDNAPAMIGPNAILQSVETMREALGEKQTAGILRDAQITALPSGEHMIPEIEAIRLHRWLSLHEPIGSYAIAAEAGRRTADYIITHRIPRAAAWVLRALPARLAAPLLMAAIRRHAWTFIGSGRFEVQDPWHFTIDRECAHDPVLPPETLFHWYAAVFTRLYRELVDPRSRCVDAGASDNAPLRHVYVIAVSDN